MRKKGFTLVEVMVAIIIIGICAGIAIPTYRNAVEKAKKAEATNTLTHIWAAEKRYYIDYGAYETKSLAKLDIEIPASEYYTYSISKPLTPEDGFLATADRTGGTYLLTINAAGVIKEFPITGGPPVIVTAPKPPPKN